MAEVHTTHVTQEEWNSKQLVENLRSQGFKVGGGILVGGITCEPDERTEMVKITQTIEGEHREDFQVRGKSQLVLEEAEKKAVQDRMGEGARVPMGRWVEQEAARYKKFASSEKVIDAQSRLGLGVTKQEQARGIEFQKIWRISEEEYHGNDLIDILIAKGARHTDGKLDGVVGYDWQEGWVVVVQTVLVSG